MPWSGDSTVSVSVLNGEGVLDSQDRDTDTCDTTETNTNPAKNRYSFLEHKWTINVAAGSSKTFFVKAYHTANTEGDDFIFEYSTDGTNFNALLTVTKTADNGAYQFVAMPASISGNVTIRVRDKDHTAGHRTLDAVYVDHLFIRSQ